MPAGGLTWFSSQVRQLVPEIPLSDHQLHALFNHFQLLSKWNERMDLTSIETPTEIVSRHYCESLFFAANLPPTPDGTTFLDFGSGAGFPGFPVAVLHPEWHMTLLEANQRRAVFLKEAGRDFPNIEVAAARAETYGVVHDWLIARAVKSADVLRCLPRLATKVGLLIGDSTLRELERSQALTWASPFKIPWSDRRFCVYGECST